MSTNSQKHLETLRIKLMKIIFVKAFSLTPTYFQAWLWLSYPLIAVLVHLSCNELNARNFVLMAGAVQDKIKLMVKHLDGRMRSTSDKPLHECCLDLGPWDHRMAWVGRSSLCATMQEQLTPNVMVRDKQKDTAVFTGTASSLGH